MPQVKQITVFTVNELSDSAKVRAYDNWVSSNEYAWSAENKDTLYKFAEILNIKVTNYCYGSYSGNDGVTWKLKMLDFSYDYEEEILNLSGIRLLKYFTNNIGMFLSTGKIYRTTDGKKKRKSKVFFTCDCPLTGYYMDNVILDPIQAFIKCPNKNTFEDIINDCFHAWVKACANDIEDSNSLERFIEDCEANNYTFTESGRMENI